MATPHSRLALLAQVQLFNDGTVTVDVNLLKVTEEVSSVTDHFEHTAAAVVILVVCLQVLGERIDAVRQNCDLNLRGTCVAFVRRVLRDNGLLFVFQHGTFHLSFTMRQPSGRPVNTA